MVFSEFNYRGEGGWFTMEVQRDEGKGPLELLWTCLTD